MDHKKELLPQLNSDTRFTKRQRQLMYADLKSVRPLPKKDELSRIYGILHHDKDPDGLDRLCSRFDCSFLMPDRTPDLPKVTKKQVCAYFDEVFKIVKKVNPKAVKPKTRVDRMARYPYPGREAFHKRLAGEPHYSNYFIESSDGTIYFLKRSLMEDMSKKELLTMARQHDIFVTTPRMIKGTEDDISKDGLILQIMENPVHIDALLYYMTSGKLKLKPEDVYGIQTGEYITIAR
jgi:hypothetical protein